MKAILINPNDNTITNVEVITANDIRTFLGGNVEGVGYITPEGNVGTYEDDFIYAGEDVGEDENYVKIPKFSGNGYWHGCLLVVGSDGQGGNTDVSMSLVQAESIFKCIDKIFVSNDF